MSDKYAWHYKPQDEIKRHLELILKRLDIKESKRFSTTEIVEKLFNHSHNLSIEQCVEIEKILRKEGFLV